MNWLNKEAISTHGVMPGLVPGIHVLCGVTVRKDVDGRDTPGHDGVWGEFNEKFIKL